MGGDWVIVVPTNHYDEAKQVAERADIKFTARHASDVDPKFLNPAAFLGNPNRSSWNELINELAQETNT